MSAAGPPARPAPRPSMASMAGDRLPWDDEIDGTVEIDLASARLARELRDSARQVIGLLPAPRTAPVPLVAKQLAIAYSRLTRTTVAIVDPEARAAAPAADPERASITSEAQHPLFQNRRLDPLVRLFSPDRPAPPGAKAELLQLLLRFVEDSTAYGMIIVDLVGFVWPGELGSTLGRLDGVILVGEAGRSTEPELLSAARLIPEELSLGALLAESPGGRHRGA